MGGGGAHGGGDADCGVGLLGRGRTMKISWNGKLPTRRYAIFTDIIRGHYMIVIKGDDIERAEKWGGFVTWVGGTKDAESRKIN